MFNNFIIPKLWETKSENGKTLYWISSHGITTCNSISLAAAKEQHNATLIENDFEPIFNIEEGEQ